MDVKCSMLDAVSIYDFMEKYADEAKEYKLEIGNSDKVDDFTTVDIAGSPDIKVDIRKFITSDYKLLPDDPTISSGFYFVVKAVNVVEHIQWIYQDAFFDWIYTIIRPGGMFFIETPNLEYICKLYVRNLEAISEGKNAKFPADEYPGMANKSGEPINPNHDLQRWVNFKLFSGCSPGDFHHCCFDAYWIARMLDAHGFEKIAIASDSTLKAVGFKGKVSENLNDVDAAIERVLR